MLIYTAVYYAMSVGHRPALFLAHMITSSKGNIFRVTGHLCGEVTGEFPAQKPFKRSLDVFFKLRLNKRCSKQWRGWWFETHRAHYDVTVIIAAIIFGKVLPSEGRWYETYNIFPHRLWFVDGKKSPFFTIRHFQSFIERKPLHRNSILLCRWSFNHN